MNDNNLAIYQMRLNGYTFIEIADALKISDEQVNTINEVNEKNIDKLKKENENV